jgi:hypothetical protein
MWVAFEEIMFRPSPEADQIVSPNLRLSASKTVSYINKFSS